MASPASSNSSIGSRRSLDNVNNHPQTLEGLVSHFVAAKRALNTQTVLWRANDIVHTARQLLHENAVLAAKNAAVHNIVEQQVDKLGAVRHGIDAVGAEVETEFKQLLHHVDTSFAGLNATLAILRDTPIEAVLQPPGAPQKHLYDFIDSATVSGLEAALRACIDRYNEARATLDDSTDAFDTSLDNLSSSIENVPITPATTTDPSPIPSLYHDLEDHAKESAQAFQSLVQHYDLCITALRHTEGGSAAATQATGDTPVHAGEESPAPLEPVSEEERLEMLMVVHKDAGEVEDVVKEIQERGAEMEVLLNQAENHVNHLRNEASALSSILHMLSQITQDVKKHVTTARAFHAFWLEDTRPTLLNGIDDWESQRDFYERFDLAYAELLVEIAARRRRHDKAKRKAEEAQKELDRLHAEDAKSRDHFTLAQGDFLPLDIWPGLRDKPRRYEVRAVGERGEDDTTDETAVVQSIPQLDRNAVERALTRVERRM